jgi:hypothetical protein
MLVHVCVCVCVCVCVFMHMPPYTHRGGLGRGEMHLQRRGPAPPDRNSRKSAPQSDNVVSIGALPFWGISFTSVSVMIVCPSHSISSQLSWHQHPGSPSMAMVSGYSTRLNTEKHTHKHTNSIRVLGNVIRTHARMVSGYGTNTNTHTNTPLFPAGLERMITSFYRDISSFTPV